MKKNEIKIPIIKDLYLFLKDYFNDKKIADYIFSIYEIDINNLYRTKVSYKVFANLLFYAGNMSNDIYFCYHAGNHYTKNNILTKFFSKKLFFSVRRSLKNIDKILKKIFPEFIITKKAKLKNSITIQIKPSEKDIEINYYLAEYIKGIIAVIPVHCNLPAANINVEEYPVNIDAILDKTNILYQKTADCYLINEEIIIRLDLEERQKVVKDIYLKDIYINAKTILNCDSLKLQITWKSKSIFIKLLFYLFFIIGLAVAFYVYKNRLLKAKELIAIYFSTYTILILMLSNYLKIRNLNKIYRKTEEKYFQELSEQYETTASVQLNNTEKLQAIDNIIKISKQIIYEKDISTLFNNIRILTARALNADRATVFLHDKKNKELYSGPHLSDEKETFQIPEDKGIAGEVFKLRKIVNITDAYNNPNFNKTIDQKTGYKTETILGGPLIDPGGNLVGVIQILNKQNNIFQSIDEHILRTLSPYIASALKDSLIIDKLKQRGISSELFEGLDRFSAELLNNFTTILKTFEKSDKKGVTSVLPGAQKIYKLLKHFNFLFSPRIEIERKKIPINQIKEQIEKFINKYKNTIKINYLFESSLDQSSELNIAWGSLKIIISALIKNSIESFTKNGEIKVKIYNFVKIPNNLVHNYSIKHIIKNYNKFSPENTKNFILYLADQKPFLQNDLSKIEKAFQKYIAFDFFDNGEAIESQVIDKIFHPFFSTKNNFGMGLAIVYTAINKLNGEISEPLVSTDGKTFHFTLPCAEDA